LTTTDILSGNFWSHPSQRQIANNNPTVVSKASLLARKWQDIVGKFQGVKQRALELVLELGPSFEEVKERKQKQKSPRKNKIRTRENNRCS
jgi:hypothetical protein